MAIKLNKENWFRSDIFHSTAYGVGYGPNGDLYVAQTERLSRFVLDEDVHVPDHVEFDVPLPGDSRFVAVSPDGKFLFVGTSATTSGNRMWVYKLNGKSATKINLTAGHPTAVPSEISFSPDGKVVLVVYGGSPYISAWRIEEDDTFTHLSSFVTSANSVYSAEFSNDGNYIIVTNSNSGTARFRIFSVDYDTMTTTLLGTPETLPGTGQRIVRFSPDDEYVVVAGASGPYILVYAHVNGVLEPIDYSAATASATINFVEFEPDGRTFVCFGTSTILRFRIEDDVVSPVPLGLPPVHSTFAGANRAASSQDRTRISITTSNVPFFFQWSIDPDTGEWKRVLSPGYNVHGNGVGYGAAFSADGNTAVFGGQTSHGFLYRRLGDGKYYRQPHFNILSSLNIRSSTITASGKWAILGITASPFLRILRIDDDSYTPMTFSGLQPDSQINYLIYNAASNTLVCLTSSSPNLFIYKLDEDAGIATRIIPDNAPGGSPQAAALSPDGQLLYIPLSSSPFNAIYEIDAEGGTATKLPSMGAPLNGGSRCAAFTDDGQFLVVAKGTTFVLLARSGTTLTYLSEIVASDLSSNSINRANFIGDGDLLAVAHGTSPYLALFELDRVAGTLSRSHDPEEGLAGIAYDLAQPPTKDALFVAHATNPFHTAYSYETIENYDVEGELLLPKFGASASATDQDQEVLENIPAYIFGPVFEMYVMTGPAKVSDLPLDIDADLTLPSLGVNGLVGVDASLDAEIVFPKISAQVDVREIEGGIAEDIPPIVFGFAPIGVDPIPFEVGSEEAPPFAYGDLVLPKMSTSGLLTFPIEGEASLRLPAFSLSGTFTFPIEAEGELVLPKLAVVGEGSTPENGMLADLQLPSFSAAGDIELIPGSWIDIQLPRLGLEAIAGHAGVNAELRLPALSVQGSIGVYAVEADLRLPGFSVEGDIYVPFGLRGDFSLPRPNTDGLVDVPTEARGDLALPTFTVAADVQWRTLTAEAILPKLRASAYLSVPLVADANMILPRMISDGLIMRPVMAEAELRLPKFAVAAEVGLNYRLLAEIRFPAFRVRSMVQNGDIGFDVSSGVALIGAKELNFVIGNAVYMNSSKIFTVG